MEGYSGKLRALEGWLCWLKWRACLRGPPAGGLRDRYGDRAGTADLPRVVPGGRRQDHYGISAPLIRRSYSASVEAAKTNISLRNLPSITGHITQERGQLLAGRQLARCTSRPWPPPSGRWARTTPTP